MEQGLNRAFQEGRTNAVKAFVVAVMSGNDLSQDERFKLLQYVAKNLEQDVIVELFSSSDDGSLYM